MKKTLLIVFIVLFSIFLLISIPFFIYRSTNKTFVKKDETPIINEVSNDELKLGACDFQRVKQAVLQKDFELDYIKESVTWGEKEELYDTSEWIIKIGKESEQFPYDTVYECQYVVRDLLSNIIDRKLATDVEISGNGYGLFYFSLDGNIYLLELSSFAQDDKEIVVKKIFDSPFNYAQGAVKLSEVKYFENEGPTKLVFYIFRGTWGCEPGSESEKYCEVMEKEVNNACNKKLFGIWEYDTSISKLTQVRKDLCE